MTGGQLGGTNDCLPRTDGEPLTRDARARQYEGPERLKYLEPRRLRRRVDLPPGGVVRHPDGVLNLEQPSYRMGLVARLDAAPLNVHA